MIACARFYLFKSTVVYKSYDVNRKINFLSIIICFFYKILIIFSLLLNLRIIIHKLYPNDRPGQAVQTKILEEQSDLGLCCLPFYLPSLHRFLYGKSSLFEF